VRLIAKFDLPDPPEGNSVLQSATLRIFVEPLAEEIAAGPASLFHSVTDNDLERRASDYEDPSYTDTLMDLVGPTDAAGEYYELDVTDLVLADYAADGAEPLSAFRFQVNEAVFFEDNQGHRYSFAMPLAAAGGPRLALVFVPIPEPSTVVLAAVGLLGLVGYRWRYMRRR